MSSSSRIEEEEDEGGEKELSRNWAELPHDVLSVIFKKIGAIEILLSAQFVCHPWRDLSFHPAMWKVIDMTTLHGDNMGLDLEAMAKEAVDRSQGQLEVFWLEYFGSNDLLRHIADRTSILKCLRLISAYDISDKGLSKMVSRLPLLEELDITFGSLTEKVCRYVGKACPHLKCFRYNAIGSRHDGYESDTEALGIACSMPELRRLQLVGNKLTNKGLKEILDKCIHLEYLDLRCCFRVNLNVDTDLRAKCSRIKELRLPNDPVDDYEFDAERSWDGNFDDEDNFYPSGYSDVEMLFEDMYFDYSDGSEDEYESLPMASAEQQALALFQASLDGSDLLLPQFDFDEGELLSAVMRHKGKAKLGSKIPKKTAKKTCSRHKGKAKLGSKIPKKAAKKTCSSSPMIEDDTDEGLLIQALLEVDITPEEIELRFGRNAQR